MILGLGNDLIEIERIRAAFLEHQEKFLNRLFTDRERSYCECYRDPFPHFAGRYAGKEAIVKALGCGFGKEAGWHDIEILANHSGQPVVTFSEKLNQRFDSPKVMVSISHTQQYAAAVAIWFK